MRCRTTAIGLLAVTCIAFAQNDRGAITGTTRTYSVPSLPAGIYTVAVDAPGFKKEVRPNIEVQVAGASRVDFVCRSAPDARR